MSAVSRSLLAAAALLPALGLSASVASGAPAQWTPARPVSTTNLAQYPVLGAAASGQATAVWINQAGFQRVRLFTATSTWNGEWGAVESLIPESQDVKAPPSLAVAPSGAAIVVWGRNDADGNQVLEASTRPDLDHPWSTPVVLSSPGGTVNDPPRVAIAPDGRAVVTWITFKSSRQVIVARELDPATSTWTPQVVLSTPTEWSYAPAVAIDGSGRATVGWREEINNNGQIRVSSRDLRGTEPWSPSVPLTNDPSTDFRKLTLLADADGTTTAAWGSASYPAFDVWTATRPAPTAPWGAATRVSEDGGFGADPSLAALPGGGATVVWSAATASFQFQVATAARRTPSGPWSNPEIVSDDTEYAGTPAVVADERGNTTTAWIANVGSDYAPAASERGEAAGAPWTPTGHAIPLTYLRTDIAAAQAGDDTLVGWLHPVTSGDELEVAARDRTPPTVDGPGRLTIPPTATAGRPVTLAAAPADRWSSIARIAWSWDGQPSVTGASVAATFATAGPHVVELTVTDSAGNTRRVSRTVQVSAAPAVPPIVTTRASTLSRSGRTLRFVIAARARTASKCPTVRAITVRATVGGKRATLRQTRISSVAPEGSLCVITGRARLRQAPAPGRVVAVTVRGPRLLESATAKR